MKKRRFLFVGGSSDPGGLHIHTADVAQALAALGHAVKIVCVDRNFFSDLIQPGLVEVEQAKGLTMLELQQKPNKYRIIRAARWASILARNPGHDIVLCRGAFAETPFAELLMTRAALRRLYTIEHRPWELPWPFALSKRRYGSIMNACVRRVIAVSGELAEIATGEFGVPQGKVRTCLNWVDPNFQPPTADERRSARARLGLAEDVTAIGYLGRLGPEKRVDVLIRAFQAHLASRPSSRSVLLIAGDGWFRDQVEAEAASSGVADRIRFVGWQTDPRAILHALDLFVLPSLIEGFPLGLMEAMASGLPCIAHGMSSTRQLIDSGRNGIIADLDSADELCLRIETLMDAGPSARTEIGRAAAAGIAQTYSRAVRLPAVLDALDVGLDGAGLPPPFPRALTYRRGPI